jgi:hypothetical protein
LRDFLSFSLIVPKSIGASFFLQPYEFIFQIFRIKDIRGLSPGAPEVIRLRVLIPTTKVACRDSLLLNEIYCTALEHESGLIFKVGKIGDYI